MADSVLQFRADNGVVIPLRVHDNGDGTFSIASSATAAGSELHIGQVGGAQQNVRLEKTRPNDATPYAVNDLIAATDGLAWQMPLARVGGPGSGVIVGLGVICSDATTTPTLIVDVYEQAPATPVADNAEGTHLYVDAPKLIPKPVALPALAKPTAGSNSTEAYADTAIPFDAVDGLNVFFRLRVGSIFTPVALAKYTVVAFVLQD